MARGKRIATEPFNMKRSIGTFALRFAVTVVQFAPAASAQAPGIGQTTCRDELVPSGGTFTPSIRVRVCDSTYYPPAPPPPEPPVRYTTGSESTVPINPVAEARKTQLRATESHPSGQTGGSAVHRDPPSLCPPPYRMTASDGCQK